MRVKCPDEGSKAKTQRGLGLFFGTHSGQDNAAVITLHILLIHSNNFFYRFEPNDTHSVEMSLVCVSSRLDGESVIASRVQWNAWVLCILYVSDMFFGT